MCDIWTAYGKFILHYDAMRSIIWTLQAKEIIVKRDLVFDATAGRGTFAEAAKSLGMNVVSLSPPDLWA